MHSNPTLRYGNGTRNLVRHLAHEYPNPKKSATHAILERKDCMQQTRCLAHGIVSFILKSGERLTHNSDWCWYRKRWSHYQPWFLCGLLWWTRRSFTSPRDEISWWRLHFRYLDLNLAFFRVSFVLSLNWVLLFVVCLVELNKKGVRWLRQLTLVCTFWLLCVCCNKTFYNST